MMLSKFIHKHGLWRGVAWGIAAASILDGATFTVRGNHAATGPSFSLLRLYLPWGMHTYGIIMLFLACAVIYSSHPMGAIGRRTMYAVFVFSVWMTVFTVGGWIHEHHVAINGFSKWFLIVWVSLWLSATSEPRAGGDGAQ